MPFIKGQKSTGGRPKGVSEIRHRLRDYITQAEADKLLTRAKEMAETDPTMLKFLLEQIFGKAPQALEISGQDGQPIQIQLDSDIANKILPNTLLPNTYAFDPNTENCSTFDCEI